VEDGRRKITKCYLGPDKYTYATKQHSDMGIELKGMALADRLEGYVRQTEAQEAGAAALAAPNETVAKAQPLEAPPTVSQAQTTQPQLTPEDIDREVKRIQETVKGEFRRAQDGSLGASSPTPYAQKCA
jgi:hypothetical protein